jgi:hypothetical protein
MRHLDGLLLLCGLLLCGLMPPGLALGQSAPRNCRMLRAATVGTAAIGLPTRGAHVTSSKRKHTGSGTTRQAFCQVMGEITSVDPAAQPIRFELNLPASWNGKAVHFGGGGFDGTLADTNGRGQPVLAVKSAPTPLALGYATFGSDSGHHHHYLFLPDIYNALNASFAANLEERRNYAHDALKKTHDVAVALIGQYYGTAPKRMYFLGGSTGGREAYFVTQLWPADYDGVMGAYAGWNQVQLDLQFIRVSQAEYRPGTKLTRGWLPKSSTRLVAAKVMQACDEQDGLKDGIISNPVGCSFDLKSLACAEGKNAKDCLTPGQLQTFETFNTEQRTDRPLFHNVQSIPGFDVTSGTDLTGSMGLLRHPFRTPVVLLNSFYYIVADGVLRYFLTGDPHFNGLHFDPKTGGRYADELLPQSIASDASDADLAPFERHGGKFLMVHGTTDATIPTGSTTEFYTMLQQRFDPKTLDSFVRFYLIPGFGHGRGVFEAGFDALGVLDRWVETGVAPGPLQVKDNHGGAHGRTRPLCDYPSWPRYLQGDPGDAASFRCTGAAAAPSSAER